MSFFDSLKNAALSALKRESRKAMNKATTMVHGSAENLAPVDTGELAGSIHMEVKKLPTGWQGRVYTNLEYAMYVEFGTGNKGDGSYPYKIDGVTLAYKQDWAGMKAQPYMYPALKKNEKRIRKLFKEEVKEELRDSCKGGS